MHTCESLNEAKGWFLAGGGACYCANGPHRNPVICKNYKEALEFYNKW